MIYLRRAAIFEDDLLVSEVLHDVLDYLGFEVVAAAASLSEALEVAQGVAVDVALVDIDLRGARAYPVLDALRSRAIPYVIATGSGEHSVLSPYNEGPVISKPYNMRTIRAGIERACSSVKAADPRSI